VIQPFETFFRRLRRRFSRSEWALRRLRLKASEETGSEPGLLLIQIDGLSRQQMERAMARGRLPFLRSLVQHQHYETATFYSGLPSTTPAVQGELYYGLCCAVPAFSFLDRATKRIAAMFKPDWAKSIEADLKKEGQGLLEGGSSWFNIYTGGTAVEESHFCAASIGSGDFFKSVSLFGILSIVILQFPAVLRVIWLLIVEVLVALWDMVQGVWQGENLAKELKFILSRVLICVALREVVTIGAGVDLARGLPVVHVNFLGYDEQSHRRGPDSAFAHWSLKGIDYAIRKLYREAQRSNRRDYQIWIFSDHGQEKVRSFAEEFPGGIERVVSEGLNRMERKGGGHAARSRERASRALWAGGKRVRRRLEEASKQEFLTADEERRFSIAAMGPVGHLYLGEPMSDSEKKEFAKWLVTEGHVPGVLYLTGRGQAYWMHAQGCSQLPDEAREFLPHPGGLKEEIARDLIVLCEQKYSGDLILLGWTPHGSSWTFPIERGAHGGPGLNETSGFVLLPSKTRLPESTSEFIRPGDLRKAALHRLRRQFLPTPKRVSELAPAHRLRVMTYNVHSCLGMDGKISPHRIARVIERFDPDIVALQEIDLGRARTRGHDQAKMIAEELGMQASFCPTVVRGNELYGHALLSRLPVEVHCTGLLCGGPTAPNREPRGALLVKIQIEHDHLYFLNTHFGLGRFERASQVADLLGEKWLGAIELDEPLIVCGDFNMVPGSLPYRALASRLHDVQLARSDFRPLKTFAALFPFSRIDHIFVSMHFEVQKIQVPQNHLTRVASDHLPLIADLTFKKQQPATESPLPTFQQKPEEFAIRYDRS
jgi:endonuclease/exonuclease/phosphatase family metal-dependent hydrolase